MNIVIMNKEFESIALIEKIISLIWNDKFNEAGDFELYLPAGAYDTQLFKIGYYVYTTLSDRLMIIEETVCETGAEDGDFLTIKGHSLESILTRRVVDTETNISGNLQDGIAALLNAHVISPSDPKRKIPNVIFERSNDSRITALTMDAQYSGGENLYDVIQEALATNKIGMKMLRDSENRFVFSLYMGVDRSYAQEEIPWVAFSPEYENIISSDYTESIENYKNQIIVVGSYDEPPEKDEDSEEPPIGGEEPPTEVEPVEEKEPIPIRIEVGDNSGLDRFEFYVDARDITSRIVNEDEDDPTAEEEYLTEEEFRQKLIERGNQTLDEHKMEKDFNAEVDYNQNFKMGVDYFLGDILQVSNSYGMTASLRVNEYIISVSETGEEHYPKFVNPEKEEATTA